MARKCFALFAATAFLAAFLLAGVGGNRSWAWSNGGYSDNLAHPGYGTHDWIAQHALDWLPNSEKQFITDNLAWYLYGTELPDNKNTPGGVGDTTKHHVYFYANGSLEDDAAAVRANEEFLGAKNAFGSGNLSAAAMHLGMVAHYIADVAVFGHVMGTATVWGAEMHHSDYEEYVLSRTKNYSDEFNLYLAHDGNLASLSAYNATVAVAQDTTFDNGGTLTAVWMDQHYNWTDQTFKNLAGESLNLAVNAVADVLHTFYLERVIPEFPSGVVLAVFMFVVAALVVCFRKSLLKMAY